MDYPVILHILSYNDEHLYNLISKSLQDYKNREKFSKLSMSLLLKANIYRPVLVTFLLCSGREGMAVRGIVQSVLGPLDKVIYMCCSGRGEVHEIAMIQLTLMYRNRCRQFICKAMMSAVPGMRRHARWLLAAGIYLCCSGQGVRAAHGVFIQAQRPLVAVIYMCCSG
jgi:hypothetical protein